MGEGLQAARSRSPPTTCPSRSSTPRTSPTSPSPRSPQDGHAGELYELTGPRALRIDEAVAEIAAASGKRLRFTRITPEAYSEAAPPELAEFVVFLFTELLDGRNAEPQDGVRARSAAPRATSASSPAARRPRELGMSATLENPVTGERFTFTEVTPERLAFDFALREGGKVPIPHVHATQTERFEVVAGEVRFRLGRRSVLAQPGDVIEVPPGVTHAFANAGAGRGVDEDRGHARARDARDVHRGRGAWRTPGG